jgi:hypothetical protein
LGAAAGSGGVVGVAALCGCNGVWIAVWGACFFYYMTMRMVFALLSFEFYKKKDIATVDLIMGAAGSG